MLRYLRQHSPASPATCRCRIIEGIRRIDGPLRHRGDTALADHVERSIEHMEEIRKS